MTDDEGVFWVGARWSLPKVIDYLSVHLGGDEHAALMMLVRHHDGEPARTAAAVAAAREEQREACARHIREEFLADLDIDADSACLNAPLDATPLSDRLDELADDVLAWRLESAALRAQMEQAEARVAELEWENRQLHQNADDYMNRRLRLETAEAECGALRMRLRDVLEIAERNVADAQHLRQSAIALEAERDALFVSHANLAAVLADINEAVGGAAGEEPSLVRVVRLVVAERDALGDSLEGCHDALEGAEAERDALRAEKKQEWRERLAEKAALVSEVAALRAQVEAAEGFEFLARLLAWVEPMTSGYMRAPGMKGRPAQTWHLDDVCAGAKAAVRAMDGAKPSQGG